MRGIRILSVRACSGHVMRLARAQVRFRVQCRGELGAMWSRVLLALALSGAASAVTRVLLYEHGGREDLQLPRGNDVASPEIFLKVPIVFYGETYPSVYVNNHGVLSFRTDIASFLNAEFPLAYPSIAAFYSNVDTTAAGVVYYRETQQDSVLRKAEREVQDNFPEYDNFRAASVLLVTWSDVGYHEAGSDKRNTFQTIVISNGTESFVQFLFPDDGIQWIQGTPHPSGLPDARAQSGFVSEDGRSYTLRGSGSHQIRNIALWTNTDLPGKYLFRVGRLSPNENPAAPDHSALDIEEEYKTCSQTGPSVCHINARCVDYQSGICCQCNEGFYGNGKACIKTDVPLRVNGKLNGEINSIKLEELDIQSYVVVVDGRTYTAISRVPENVGYSLQTLNILGGVIGWLFAKPLGSAQNGYQLTGAVFNHTAEIVFTSTGDRVFVRQQFFGHDLFDQVNLEADVRGTVPPLALGTKVEISEYEEQYTTTEIGVIRSNSVRVFRDRNNAIDHEARVTQTFHFSPCQHAPLDDIDKVPVTLKVAKNFLGYEGFEGTEGIVRYGMSNKVVPLGQEDPCIRGRETCTHHSSCIVDGDSFKCVCDSGYQAFYQQSGREICLDIDECALGTHNCDDNAQCHNYEGSFQCACNGGFEGDGVTCEKVSPCRNYVCDPNAYCRETYEGPECVCNDGFTGNGQSCWLSREPPTGSLTQSPPPQPSPRPTDPYSRSTRPSPTQPQVDCRTLQNCSPYASCNRSPYNTYSCECSIGFFGNGFTCYRDEAPSQLSPRPTDPYLVSTYPSPTQPQVDCRTLQNCSPYAACNRSPYNTYSCECSIGFYGNGFTCYREEAPSQPSPRPTDPYLVSTHPSPTQPQVDCRTLQNCSPYATCKRSPYNTYSCECSIGFYGNGFTCYREDAPPTSTTTENYEDDSVVEASCFVGWCSCGYGYDKFTAANGTELCRRQQPKTEPPRSSTDEEYTTLTCTSSEQCPHNSECQYNTISGYKECRCWEGFVDNDGECVDEQQQRGSGCGFCDGHASCAASETGESVCVCDAGYTGNGAYCNPSSDSECHNDTDCEANAACRFDSYTGRKDCQCRQGYNKDANDACVPEGETCNGARCAEHATCQFDPENQIDYCQCDTGYEGEGIDKCEVKQVTCEEARNCDPDALCVRDEFTFRYSCICKEGYEGDGYRCTPIRTCLNDPHMCDRQASCVRKINGYACECNSGFSGDGRTCKADPKPEGGFILLATGTFVLRVPFSPTYRDVVRPIQNSNTQTAVGLDVDCQTSKVYWGDVTGRVINSAYFDGSGLEMFTNREINSPEGVSVDWVSRNIYWTDSKKLSIEVANLDTKIRTTLIHENLVNPRGIAVHPQRGKIFWSDWNRQGPKIEWANMDGSDRAIFIAGNNVLLPNSLVIDWRSDRLCYADAGVKKIECVQIDTLEKETIATNCSYPFGLAATGDTFYWTDWKTKKIEYVNQLTKERGSIPVSSSGSKMFGMAVAPEQCLSLSNVCQYQNGQCPAGHLCLLNGQQGRSCVCGTNDLGLSMC